MFVMLTLNNIHTEFVGYISRCLYTTFHMPSSQRFISNRYKTEN
jgi:hypothetical protein